MLDDHNTGVSEELLGVVVDELSVNENVGSVLEDFVDLSLHLHLLGLLDLGNGGHGVDLDLGAHNLNFVVVHRGVGDKDTGLLNSAITSGSDALLENHTVGNERVSKSATGLLDDLDVIHVAGSLKSEDGLDGELSESATIVEQKLGGESGHSDVSKISLEFDLISRVVHGDIFQNFLGGVTSNSPSLDDNLRVNSLRDKLLGLLEEFTGHDGNSGGTITDLFVLGHGDVDKDFGGRVVDVNRFEDGGSVISDSNLLARLLVTHGLEDLVHALGSKSGLDQVRDGDSADESLL